MSGVLRSRARSTPISEVPSFIEEALAAAPTRRTATIGVVSSVNLGPIDLLLRKYAAVSGVDLRVVGGGYDNPVEDAQSMGGDGLDVALFVPFVDNFLPALSSTIDLMSAVEQDEVAARFVSRWELAAGALPPSADLVVVLPHRTGGAASFGPGTSMPTWHHRLAERLATALASVRPTAFIDADRVLARLGEGAMLDRRLWFRGKVPYAVAAVDEFARLAWLQSREFGTRFYKALVLDCDNTLWGGVIGEDGLHGIALDPHDHPGNAFWEVQQRIRHLQSSGVLLCLATKNEPADVEMVLEQHPSRVIRPEDLAARRIGWGDKPTMLRELAEELNIGLDSMVFVDDSEFECGAVSSLLPEVVVRQVPARASDYPSMFDEIVEMFGPVLSPGAGGARTEAYRQRRESLEARASFASNEEYLASLGITVRLVRNEIDRLQRLSELTMKTNQFNLTTLRLTQAELLGMLEGGSHDAWSCHVSDRYGDSGLVGLALVERRGDVADMVAFMLSCRVLGRGVEAAVVATLCSRLLAEGTSEVRGRYVPSARNQQTSDFLDRAGFAGQPDGEGGTRYSLADPSRIAAPPAWITVVCDA
jgi:FkbH-like protein